MTRDDIIRMAREAGGHISSFHGRFVMYADDLERFAALVAAAEREACAKVCEENAVMIGVLCAAAIRARSQDAHT
jgi:hypothetical protein